MAAPTPREEQQQQEEAYEDLMPVMADRLGTAGLLSELRAGFRLLADPARGAITADSLRRGAEAALGVVGMTPQEAAAMVVEGDADGDGVLSEAEFCVLMVRLSPGIMDDAEAWLEEAIADELEVEVQPSSTPQQQPPASSNYPSLGREKHSSVSAHFSSTTRPAPYLHPPLSRSNQPPVGQAHAHATPPRSKKSTKAKKGDHLTGADTKNHHGGAAHDRTDPPAPSLLLLLSQAEQHRHHHLSGQKTAAATTNHSCRIPVVAAAAQCRRPHSSSNGGGDAGDAAGRAGGGRRVRDPGGPERGAAAPARHGRALRLHALGGVPRVAVAPGAHHPGRHQRAQEAGQARRCSHAGSGRSWCWGRGVLLSTRRAHQVSCRDQDRRAHRGAQEAAQGLVPGPPFQRRVHPARPRRARVRRRRAQHLAQNRKALPRATPLRRSSHHRAVGGSGGAGPGDAEGQRDGEEPAHRAQHAQRPPLHLADTHRARDRREGLRVHNMAMNGGSASLGMQSSAASPPSPSACLFSST